MSRKSLFDWVRVAAILVAVSPFAVIAGEPERIPVGVSLSFTGEYGRYGELHLGGMKLFVDDFNSRASEHGMHIELVIRDDASDPATAARIVDELAAGEGVGVIIGAMTSDIGFAMIERTRDLGIVLISPSATNPGIGTPDDWAFRLLPGDDSQGQALAKFFAGQMEAHTAAVALNTSFVYGMETAEAFKKTFMKKGGKIVGEERYEWDYRNSDSFDFSDIIASLRRSNPDVVLLPGFVKEAVEFIRQAGMVDWSPYFCGGESWLNTATTYSAGRWLDDSYYVGGAEIFYSTSPEARRYIELMEAVPERNLKADNVNGYDAMMLLAEILRKGARKSAEIRAELHRLKDFPLVSGKLSFAREGGTGKTLYIYQIKKMTDGFYSEAVAEVHPD